MKYDRGCILLARKIQESDIWSKPSDWLKLWIYLLQEVNHSGNKMYDRGENFFNYREIAKDCGVSYNTVAKFFKWAKSAMLVAIEKTTRGARVKVLNYADYQSLKSYENKKRGDTSGDTEAIQKRYRSDTIIEECKNDKNDKKELFEIFWKLYPNKTAKKEAFTLWAKMSSKDRDSAVSALPAQVASEKWTKDGGIYIPNPAKWLRHDRWNDEVQAVQKAFIPKMRILT